MLTLSPAHETSIPMNYNKAFLNHKSCILYFIRTEVAVINTYVILYKKRLKPTKKAILEEVKEIYKNRNILEDLKKTAVYKNGLCYSKKVGSEVGTRCCISSQSLLEF